MREVKALFGELRSVLEGVYMGIQESLEELLVVCWLAHDTDPDWYMQVMLPYIISSHAPVPILVRAGSRLEDLDALAESVGNHELVLGLGEPHLG